ncbi:MAG: hypothetical protein Q4A21_02175 [bacterium]|nr:hypothetical protein [bacterium]
MSINFGKVGSDGRKGVYWIGQNGNLYIKGNDAPTQDLGKFNHQDGVGLYAEKGGINSKFYRRVDDWNKNDAAKVSQPPSSTGLHYSGGASSGPSAEDLRQQKFYQGLLDSLPGRKAATKSLIDEKYNNSFNKLTNQRDNAFRNLDSEQSKLDRQRSRAYGQIQNDSQNMLQGLNTQIGMYGAGNSSAAQMGAIATADLANKQSSEITDDYNDQVSNISSARANLRKEYEDENNELNTWKKEQHQAADEKFQNEENNYRSKIGGQANLDAVVNSFKNMKTPDIKLDKLPEYKADGLSKVDLASQAAQNQGPSLTAQQAQKYFANTSSVNSRKKSEDDDDKPVMF